MTADGVQAATALLTEHLQYTPLSLIDEIINAVNELVYQGISSLENGLFSTPPDRLGFKPEPQDPSLASNPDTVPEYPEAKREIEEGLHKLETLLESTVDKNFDKFEIYVLRNILSVPDDLAGWIRLSHYENISHPSAGNCPSIESIQLLRRKVAASRTVNSNLLAESARNDQIIEQLKALTTAPKDAVANGQQQHQPNFSFLKTAPSSQAFGISTDGTDSQPLTTNTTFTLLQLPALRALLMELRQKLTAVRTVGSNVESARDERRQERREYIEQRIRLHLQRNDNPGMDEGGFVNGRKIDMEEVEAMEKVSSMFGRHR